MHCCKRFCDVVDGSLLLQYAYRTELTGVYDPLWGLSVSGRSIAERLEMLGQWEASWRDLGRYLAAAPQLVIPTERNLFGPYFLCDDCLFTVNWQGSDQTAGAHEPALLYIDLRNTLCTGQHVWKQIDYPRGSIAITQAFSVEEDDLIVSSSSLIAQTSSPSPSLSLAPWRLPPSTFPFFLNFPF